MVGLPDWRICVQPSPIGNTPKSSVMRFEISPDISSSFAAVTSPGAGHGGQRHFVGDARVVGNEHRGKKARTDKAMSEGRG